MRGSMLSKRLMKVAAWHCDCSPRTAYFTPLGHFSPACVLQASE